MDGSNAIPVIDLITLEEMNTIRAGTLEEATACMQRVLNRVEYAAVMHALLGFPDTIRLMFRNAQRLEEMKKEFFDKNPDLKDHIKEFAEMMVQVESESPAKPYEELMNEALRRVRATRAAKAITPPVQSPPLSEIDQALKGEVE